MPDSTLNLAAGFDTPSYEDWKTLVESGLKGRSFDRAMMSDAPDGFRIKPLYTSADLSPVPDAAGFPGFSPFVRGMTVDGRGWQVHQRHDHPDPKRANSQILKDLERGASGITLVIDPTAQKGVAIHDLEDLDQALLDMDLAIAPLHLEAGRFGIPAAALLMALWDKRGLAFDAVSGHFGVDPLGALAAEGSLLSPLPDALREAGALAAQCHDRFPKMTALSVSSEAAHSAGATEAQELAIALATGLAYLRASEQAGLALDDAARQIRFCLMADTDVTLTIAKFRAMRCLWSRVLMACGVAQPIMALDAQTAPRMMSRRDPMVNVLRATMACFGASIGGADALMISPHTDAIGIADDFARRIARNVQIILAEESHLGRVMDPAGGSFTMEAQSNQLAEKAWDIFQSIEANGGMEAALMDGKIAAMLEKSWSNLQKDVATRRVPLIGVSEFPNIHETAVAVESVDRAALAKESMKGVEIAANAATLPPLPRYRLGQDFEALRDRADAHAVRPKVFLATVGRVADFTARATWTRHVFETGGFDVVIGEGGFDAGCIADQWQSLGASEVVLCGADKDYADHGMDIAKALKAAGAPHLMLAGKGGDQESAWRHAGVDGFLHMGIDIVALLGAAHDRADAAQGAGQ